MNLTFKGFLKNYLRDLSEQESLSLRKLVYLAEEKQPRLIEPLFAYAAIQKKEDYLRELSKNAPFEETFDSSAKALKNASSIEAYLSSPDAPPRFQNVWKAYQSKKNIAEPSRRIVGLMRPYIIDALNKSATTIYRMCKDLKINQGNAYAYLNGEDDTKISKATADRMLDYLNAKIVAQ